MKKINLLLLAALVPILISCGAQKHRGNSDDARNTDTIDENGILMPPEISVKPKPIPGFTRGLNLGNGLDAPSEGEWGVILEDNHFVYPAKAGFDHVRLPVRFSTRTMQEAPYTVEEKFFQRVDWAIEQAKKNKLSIIVDVHHYEEIMKEPKQHEERLWAIWKQIANRYKDEPATVAFEVLNEPCFELKSAILNPMMKKAIEIIRETNPQRLIFVNSYFWASTQHLKDLDLSYADDNVIATFHMYQPMLFSHQGASWMGPEFQTQGVVFPGPPKEPIVPKPAAEQVSWTAGWFEMYNRLPAAKNPSGPKTIYQEFGRATAYVERTGRRIYLGEFACIDNADPQSRANFIRLVRTESERRGIGWAFWDDGGKNKALDVHTGEWVDYIFDALLK